MAIYLQSNEQDQVKQNYAINQLVRNFNGIRKVLSASTTFYVRSDGSDTHDGLTNSAGGAFASWTGCYNSVVGAYDFGGQAVTIQGGTSTTYSTGISITQPWTGGGSLTLLGDATTLDGTNTYHLPAQGFSITNAACINVTTDLPGACTIRGFKLATSGIGQGINHNGGGTIQIDSMQFDACGSPHIICQGIGGRILFTNNCTITGGAPAHMRTFFPNVIEAINTMKISIVGTMAFSSAFSHAIDGGVIYFGAGQVTYDVSAATVTGTRYLSDSGIINTNNGGGNYYPGNVAGIKSNGGIYK